ncbi:YjaA family stress response protein [Phytobacter diazotrophicus]|uniref:YjaA family stress response protein n=1 Tax=Phytobacter diazotrophicus TaxID=395631 RepID=UPI00232FBDBA|nr:YjaA family stress response protein [Phytobacter diazotrophicus]MDC0728807.1 YjaA family stress response protein [Phytobacter diazotrophicus]MDC0736007.1 YjaA family stress response protein [Phytobacter diazotrophicus]
MSVLYIQVRKNHITVRNIERKQDVAGSGAFSNQRLLIADFFKAEKVLWDLIEQIRPRSWFRKLLRTDRFDIVISALEMNEGGLSQVEERILQEVVAGATRMRYRCLITHAQSTPLSDDAVMALIAER